MRCFLFCAVFFLGIGGKISPTLATDDGEVVAQSTAQFNEIERAAEAKLASTDFFPRYNPLRSGHGKLPVLK
jgi:hypothetical protein